MKKAQIVGLFIGSVLVLFGTFGGCSAPQAQADRVNCYTLAYDPPTWTVRTESGELTNVGTSPAEDGPITWADESGRIAAETCGVAQNTASLGATVNPVKTGHGRMIDGRMVKESDVPACQTLDYSGRTGSWSVFTSSGELVLIGWASAEDAPIVWASERGKALGPPCLPD